jgi:hypothetical protein
MAAVATIYGVLHSYTFVWGVYERFLDDCDRHPQVAQNATVLLLCFDHSSNQVIFHLSGMSTTILGHLVSEASCVIHCLHMRNLLAGPLTLLLPTLY